ncbi:MAG: hypothetical protein U1D30_04410 [Planctomycetota bacterium]
MTRLKIRPWYFLIGGLCLLVIFFAWPSSPLSEREELQAAILAEDNDRWEFFAETADMIFANVGIPVRLDQPEVHFRDLARKIADREGQKSIPLLIGVMDADNSVDTVYQLGYFSLQKLTGVEYSPFHDGRWWRRWWEKNRHSFPEDVRETPIPIFSKSRHGESYIPFPNDIYTLQGKLRLAVHLAQYPRDSSVSGIIPYVDASQFAEEVAKHYDPRALPYLIALAETDTYIRSRIANSLRTLAGIDRDFVPVAAGTGEFRDPKTGKYFHDRQNDAGWWRNWWEAHRHQCARGACKIDIPDLTKPLTFSWKE